MSLITNDSLIIVEASFLKFFRVGFTRELAALSCEMEKQWHSVLFNYMCDNVN